MGSAVTAIFTADGRPMEAEFARMETVGKRFGKTLADVNAADNARMLANSEALKQLIAERKASKDELDRYNAALMANAGGLRTVADANKAENAELLRKSEALKQLLAQRKALKGVSGDLMTVNAPESILKGNKIADYLARKEALGMRSGRGQTTGFASYLAKESEILAAESGAQAGNSWFSNFAKNLKSHGSGGMQQLIHVFRASFDSLASGMSPWRVAMQQGPQALQAFTSMSGATITALLGVAAAIALPAAAIGGLILAVVGFGVALRNMAQAQRNAQEISDNSAVKFADEASAMHKAADAAREFNKWLEKLNETHNSLTEQSDETVAALRRNIDAQNELVDARKESALLDVDKREKTGQITHQQAVQERTRIEVAAIKQKSDFEIKAHKQVLDQIATDAIAAQKKSLADEQAAVEAEAALQSPESKRKLAEIATAQRHQSEAEAVAAQMEKNKDASKDNLYFDPLTDKSFQRVEVGGKKFEGSLEYWKAKAAQATENVTRAQTELTPAENAARKAREQAERSSSAADSLGKSSAKALSEYQDLVKNSPAAVAAKQANIAKRGEIDSMFSGAQRGFGLNSAQQRGAYASTPPDWKRLVDASVQTAHNTAGMRPNRSAPPRANGPSHSGRGTGSHH